MQPKTHYLALDGLRGVAALAVLYYHDILFFQTGSVPFHAYLAVDFFFMLSGFVIAQAYDRRLSSGLSAYTLLKIRFIRIYPLVALGVAFGTAALLVWAHLTGGVRVASVIEAAAANLVFLPSTAMLYVRPWAFPSDGPLWSLAFEVWINVLYIVTFRMFIKSGLGIVLLVGAALLIAASLANGGLNIGFSVAQFYLGFARVLFPFTVGVFMSRNGLSWLPRSWCGNAIFLALIAVFICPPAFSGSFDAIAVLLIFPVVLLIGARATPNRYLDPLWRAIGGLSYPLYVLHYPFVVAFSNLAHQHHLTGRRLDLAAVATYGGVIVLSLLTQKLYDAPLRKFLTRKLVGKTLA